MLNYIRSTFLLKLIIFTFIIISNGKRSYSQTLIVDSTNNKALGFRGKALIVPTFLIGYGLIGIESDALKIFNTEIREEVQEHIDKRMTIDDFSQYSPIIAAYSLNLVGIKGKNNFANRTIILATSYIIMGASVYSLKNLTQLERPDGSAKNSFPSGHTATAFMGAEFLWQEYKNVSPWYGIAGYVVAGGTGAFRIYNNRHWLTDVVAGAGIGILSTKIAYWINPVFSNKNSRERNSTKISYSLLPFYNNNKFGLSFALRL